MATIAASSIQVRNSRPATLLEAEATRETSRGTLLIPSSQMLANMAATLLAAIREVSRETHLTC